MSTKNVANLSGSTGLIDSDLILSTGTIIAFGQTIILPTITGAIGTFLKALGNGVTTWAAPVLGDLAGITIAAPVNGQVLQYQNGVWINATLTGASVGLGNVENYSRAQMFNSTTFTGTVSMFNLNVTGTQTIAHTTDLAVTDNFITVNADETGAGVTLGTAGAIIDRGTLPNYVFVFRESDQTFSIGQVGNTAVVACREDTPLAGAIAAWNSTTFKFDTTLGLSAFQTTQYRNLTTTISTAQWGYFNDSNQSVATDTSPTFAGLTITGFTGMVSSMSGILQTTSFASDNGVAVTFGTSILKINTSQDLRISASPVFVGATLNGLTAYAPVYMNSSSAFATTAALANGQLLIGTGAAPVAAALTSGSNIAIVTGAGSITIATSTTPTFAGVTIGNLNGLISAAGGVLQLTSYASGNGIITSFSGAILTISTAQDIRTTASPTFAGATIGSLSGLISAATGVLQSTLFASDYGVVTSFTTATLKINTPQDLQTTASPVFAGLTLSNISAFGMLYATSLKVVTSTAAPINGQLLIGSTGAVPQLATLTGSSNIIIGNAAGAITITTVAVPSFTSVTLTSMSANSFVYSSAAKVITSTAAVDGQLLIGSTSGAPTAATLTNGSNIVITNASGSITVATSTSPTFAGATIGSLNGIISAVSGVLQTTSYASANGIAASFTGSVLTISTAQDLRASASPTFAGATIGTLNGLINAATGVLQTTSYASANGIAASFTGSVLTISTAQDLRASASPTFAGATIGSLSGLISATSGILQATTYASTNGIVASFTGSVLTISTAQSIQTSASPLFAGLTLTSLTPYAPVYMSSGGLVSTTTALTDGQLMIGSTGAVPVSAALISGSNITITNASGSITVATKPSVTFTSVTITGLNGLISAATGVLQSTLFASDYGVVTSFTTATLKINTPQDLQTTASPTFVGLTLSSMTTGFLYTSASAIVSTAAPTNGQLLIGSTSGVPVLGLITVGTNMSIATGAGTIAIASSLTPTFTSVTITGLNGLISAASGVLQATTYASANGILASFATSVLTISTSQDLRATASPTFVGAILTGVTATTLASFSAAKGFQSTTFSSANGVAVSFATSILTISTAQDVQTTAAPTFAGLTLTGLNGLISAASGVLQATTYASANGVLASFATSVLTISTSQDLRATASPTFVGLSLTSAAAIGFLYTSANAITSTALPAVGQLLIGTGAVPVLGTLTASTNITVVNGAGTITLATSLTPSFTTVTLTGATAFGFLYSSALKVITSTAAPTNGQLLIGSTGAIPVAAALTAGTNIVVTNAAGAITLATSLTPSFTTVTLTGATAFGFLYSSALKVITSTAAPTNGQLLIGSTGAIPVAAALTAGTNIVVTNAAGAITLATSLTPTFTTVTQTGLSGLVSAASGVLQNTTFASVNSVVASFATNVLTISTAQDIQTTASPTFVGATITGSTAFAPVYMSSTKAVTTTAAALTNGQLLIGTTSGAPVAATLTAGANISITNAAGAITIASTGITTTGILLYQTGTIAQSGASVTGSGTTFTSAMVGGLFISAGSAATTITRFTSATVIIVAVGATVAAGTSYIIYYQAANGSFAVSSNGNIFHGVQNLSGQSTTCEYWQLQNGNSVMAFDYSTYASTTNAPNARMTIEDDGAASTNWKFWSRISGADANVLQTNFTIGSDRSVKTANNILDNGTGSMTIGSSLSLTGALSAGLLTMNWTSGVGISIRDLYNGSFWLTQENGVSGSIWTLNNQLDDGKGNMLVSSISGQSGGTLNINSSAQITGTMTINGGSTTALFVMGNTIGSSIYIGNTSGTYGRISNTNGIGTLVADSTGGSVRVNSTAVTIAPGIMLPTTGGTSSLLSYYEELLTTIGVGGAWASTATINVKFTRVGTQVTMIMDADYLQNGVSATTLVSSAIPARFRFNTGTTIRFWFFGMKAAAPQPARCDLGSSGVFTFYSDTAGSVYPSGQCGIYQSTFTWSII